MEFSAQAKGPVDIIVRTYDYTPGSSTGWHSHLGPVFIEVIDFNKVAVPVDRVPRLR
jgi:hypothetical protein